MPLSNAPTPRNPPPHYPHPHHHHQIILPHTAHPYPHRPRLCAVWCHINLGQNRFWSDQASRCHDVITSDATCQGGAGGLRQRLGQGSSPPLQRPSRAPPREPGVMLWRHKVSRRGRRSQTETWGEGGPCPRILKRIGHGALTAKVGGDGANPLEAGLLRSWVEVEATSNLRAQPGCGKAGRILDGLGG